MNQETSGGFLSSKKKFIEGTYALCPNHIHEGIEITTSQLLYPNPHLLPPQNLLNPNPSHPMAYDHHIHFTVRPRPSLDPGPVPAVLPPRPPRQGST